MALFDEWMVRRVQSRDSLREEKTKRGDRERGVIANFINKPLAFVESQTVHRISTDMWIGAQLLPYVLANPMSMMRSFDGSVRATNECGATGTTCALLKGPIPACDDQPSRGPYNRQKETALVAVLGVETLRCLSKYPMDPTGDN